MPNDFWCCSFLITKIKRKILEKVNISLKSLHYCAKLSSCEIFSSSGGNHERTGDQRQAAAFLREELRYRKAVRSKRPYIRCLCKLPRERRKYVLSKKAELWRISCHEHAYFKAVEELNDQDVETFLTDLTEWIEPKVVREGKEVPDTDHMYTLVTGIFFADKPVADSVKKKIRKYKYYKNYRFSLRGYCQVRLLVFDTAEQKVFGNRAAWELVKGYAKMFRS